MSASSRILLITIVAAAALAAIVVLLLPSRVDTVLDDMAAADLSQMAASDTLPTGGTPFPIENLACRATAYAPVLATVYVGGRHTQSGLAATLSIRNVSETDSFALTRSDYYDSNGMLLKRYVETPVEVAPLQTVEFYIDVIDREGGSGANFVIGWAADPAAPSPLIETVMIGSIGARGISFVSRAVDVEKTCR